MKKIFTITICLLMVSCFTACQKPQTKSQEKTDSTTSLSEETTSPSSTTEEESAESADPVSPISPVDDTSADQPSGEAFKVELDKNQMFWAKNTIPVIYLTTYFPEYVFEKKENYPAKFITFLPVENTVPYGFNYDSTSYYDDNSMVSYTYALYDYYPEDEFFKKSDSADILKDGSDGIAMKQDPDSRWVKALIDISNDFQDEAKLYLDLYINSSQSRMTIEDLVALCEQEIERINSTMQVVTLSDYWSQGRVSTVELFDFYDNYIVTVDTSSLTPVKVENDEISYHKVVDGKAVEYSIELGSYKHDEAVEKNLPDGTKYYERATEYTTYRYVYIVDSKRDEEVYLCITGDEIGAPYEEEFDKLWKSITVDTGK